jgi:hypothetical protein
MPNEIHTLIPDEINLIILISEHFQTIFWVLMLVVLLYMVKDYFFNCLIYSIRYLFGREHDGGDKIMLIVEGVKIYAIINKFNFWKSTVTLYIYDCAGFKERIAFATISQKDMTEWFSMEIFSETEPC